MYIVAYDISNPKRLRKVAALCQKYMMRVQKSVFEGDLSQSQLYALKRELKKKINKSEDSILIYFITSQSFKKKILLGKNVDFSYIVL